MGAKNNEPLISTGHVVVSQDKSSNIIIAKALIKHGLISAFALL